MEMGRPDEARAMLARYGSVMETKPATPDENAAKTGIEEGTSGIRSNFRPLLGLSIALTFVALAWGFVNFGVLLWLPIEPGRDRPQRRPHERSHRQVHAHGNTNRGTDHVSLQRLEHQARW